MNILWFLLAWTQIDRLLGQMRRNEEQARRAQLTRAECKAEDAKRDADDALQICLFVIVTLGFGVAFLILVSLRG